MWHTNAKRNDPRRKQWIAGDHAIRFSHWGERIRGRIRDGMWCQNQYEWIWYSGNRTQSALVRGRLPLDYSGRKSKYKPVNRRKRNTISTQFPRSISDQHVSLSVMHIENEPIFQNYMSTNGSLNKCLRKIFVRSFSSRIAFWIIQFYWTAFQIYEGTSPDGPQLLEICSSKHPPTVVSSGNALTIALANVTEFDFAFAFDFKAYYTVIENGKRICKRIRS